METFWETLKNILYFIGLTSMFLFSAIAVVAGWLGCEKILNVLGPIIVVSIIAWIVTFLCLPAGMPQRGDNDVLGKDFCRFS